MEISGLQSAKGEREYAISPKPCTDRLSVTAYSPTAFTSVDLRKAGGIGLRVLEILDISLIEQTTLQLVLAT